MLVEVSVVLPGEEEVVVLVDELLLDFEPLAGDGFTIVVLLSFLSAPAGVTTVFSSHAARSAAPAKMQMYFFIINVVAPFTGQTGIERTLPSGLA